MCKVEQTASPTLSEKDKTVMRRLAEVMAPIYSIHYVDFRKLVEYHELGAGENLVGKVGFVL